MTPCLTGPCCALVCLLCSCSLVGPEAVLRVRIEKPPDRWIAAFPGLAFRIVHPDAQGVERETVSEDWRAPISLWCSKAGNTPVLAYPEVPGDPRDGGAARSLLPPAGGVYPLSLDPSEPDPTIVLSWEDGCLALVLRGLRMRGLDVSLVNSRRLAECLRAAADPFVWDSAAIAEKLAGGAFAARDIEVAPAREVRLRPGKGTWFLESPFSPEWTAGNGETLVLPGISLGMHGMFERDGRAFRFFVGQTETIVLEN